MKTLGMKQKQRHHRRLERFHEDLGNETKESTIPAMSPPRSETCGTMSVSVTTGVAKFRSRRAKGLHEPAHSVSCDIIRKSMTDAVCFSCLNRDTNDHVNVRPTTKKIFAKFREKP